MGKTNETYHRKHVLFESKTKNVLPLKWTLLRNEAPAVNCDNKMNNKQLQHIKTQRISGVTYINIQDLVGGSVSEERFPGSATYLVGPSVDKHGARSFIFPWSVDSPVSIDNWSPRSTSESWYSQREEPHNHAVTALSSNTKKNIAISFTTWFYFHVKSA